MGSRLRAVLDRSVYSFGAFGRDSRGSRDAAWNASTSPMERCSHDEFALEEELGHVESVDWDLGSCRACGTPLLRQWSEYAPASVSYDALSDDDASALRASRDRERVMLLKAWYAAH
jgi:hypothetical protein